MTVEQIHTADRFAPADVVVVVGNIIKKNHFMIRYLDTKSALENAGFL